MPSENVRLPLYFPPGVAEGGLVSAILPLFQNVLSKAVGSWWEWITDDRRCRRHSSFRSGRIAGLVLRKMALILLAATLGQKGDIGYW